jgi:hypothetical protein
MKVPVLNLLPMSQDGGASRDSTTYKTGVEQLAVNRKESQMEN